MLKNLHLMLGYEDIDYNRFYRSNVKIEPKAEDEVMTQLFGDFSTLDWNPLIFAIFY